ncbi:MAG: peptidyl-prolyl cis-trans isomerase, partial [Candidatus Krumholzibacteria bacterium]
TGTATNSPDVIGSVNGVSITRSQYQLAYQQIAEQFRSASPDRTLSYAQEQFIGTQTWDNLVYAILTDLEISRLGITVTDQEIVAYLRTSPPPEIRQYFLDEQGNFDDNRYQAELNNPANDWTNLEQLARERIPRLKLNGYLSAQVHVSEEEIRHAYNGEAVELTLEYVTFSVQEADGGDFEPEEEAIEEYYRTHADEFQEPDKARLQVVRIPLKPSNRDFEDAAFTARHVVEKLRAGGDFADLAKTFSDAPTAFADGNTGFIGRDQRDGPYFDALDGMASGDISDAVLTESGYYVLKFLAKRTGESGEPEYDVQEIMVKTVLSRQTVDSLFGLADDVRQRAQDADLQAAAQERQLETFATEPFSEGTPVGALGFVPALSDFALGGEVGSLSNVLRDETNIYLARIVEHLPAATTPLADVRDVVRNQLIYNRKKSVAEIGARAFFQKARATDFKTSAETYGVAVNKPEPFRAQENLDDFGPNSNLAEAALAVAPGEVVPPIEVGGSLVVFHLIQRSDIDPEDYKERIPVLRDLIRNQKVQNYVGEWYESLKTASKIEDYRSQS